LIFFFRSMYIFSPLLVPIWVLQLSAWGVVIGVLAELQPECLMSCNSFDKNYKNYMSRVATEVHEELQLECLPCCNRSACWVAIRLIKIYKNYMTRVASEVLEELQLKCLLSCDSSDTNNKRLHVQTCNWSTWGVAIEVLAILYYPFSCNRTVVRVAIDAHSELQILSASVWYYTTPSVASGQ
jgi:hypothetical protein